LVQDLFLNETAKFAHVFLPGASFLEKDGTFTNAERRINRVRAVMKPKSARHEWEIVCQIATAMGYPMGSTIRARSWTRSPRSHDIHWCVLQEARRSGQHPMALQRGVS